MKLNTEYKAVCNINSLVSCTLLYLSIFQSHFTTVSSASSQVPDCYIVSFRDSARLEAVEAVIEELTAMDANETLPDFKATILDVIRMNFHGFTAILSQQALEYVS